MTTPSSLPPAPNPLMLPVFGTVAYGAAVIALWGFVSLGTNSDVIAQRDAGPLLGPAMLLGACIVTLLALLRVRGSAAPAITAAVAAASTYASLLVIGAVGYTLIRADLAWLVLFVGGYALSPFVLGAAILSGLVVLGTWAVAKRA